jgi:hypothetical protein
MTLKETVWPVPQSEGLFSRGAYWKWMALVVLQLLGGSDFLYLACGICTEPNKYLGILKSMTSI